MPNFANYPKSINWSYTPAFKTITISTKRAPAMASGKIGTPTTHLTGVESSPLILPSQQSQHAIRQAVGLEGTAVQLWELRMHKTPHIDGGVSVDQLPDIAIGDRVTIDNVDYVVSWADIVHPLSFGDILLVYVKEDKRA